MIWDSQHCQRDWSYQHSINFTLLTVTKPRAVHLGWQEDTSPFLWQEILIQVHLHPNYIPGVTNPPEMPRFACSDWLAGKYIITLTWAAPSFHILLPCQHSWNASFHPTHLFFCNTILATWPQIFEDNFAFPCAPGAHSDFSGFLPVAGMDECCL